MKQETTRRAADYWAELDPTVRAEFTEILGGSSLSNIEAEQALLGALLVNNLAIGYLGQLLPEQFFEPVHQRIFAAIMELYALGKIATPLTLRHYFEADEALVDIGGGEYLARLAAASVTVINITDFGDLIHDLAVRRRLANLLLAELRKLAKPQMYGERAADVQMRMVDALVDIDAGLSLRRIKTWKEVSQLVVTDVETALMPDGTGIPLLDDALLGGFHPRRSYCIQARMKVGKTGLMLSGYTNVVLAYQSRYDGEYAAWAQGQVAPDPKAPGAPRKRTTLYVCAEMGERESHQRNLARLLGYNSTAFVRHRDDMDFLYRLHDWNTNYADLPGLYYDAPGITFGELRHVMTVAARRLNLGGIFFDHLGLVRPDKGKRREYSSKVDLYEDVCAWIAQFCKEYNVWCVYASQTNREGNTRGGDAPDMFADAIMQLETDEDREIDEVKTTVAWVKMKAIRYNARRDVGNSDWPKLMLHRDGPHFCQIPEGACVKKSPTYSACDGNS